MTTAIALTALAHLAALVGVLVLAHRDHVLVDEAGMPISPAAAGSDWHEATIPVPMPVAIEADRPL